VRNGASKPKNMKTNAVLWVAGETCSRTPEGDLGSLKNLTPAQTRWCSAANHDMRWAIMPQQVLRLGEREGV
jgi:hypothetical protein